MKKFICRVIVIAVVLIWISLLLGLSLSCAADEFGSWWKAIEMLLGCIVIIFSVVAGLVWAIEQAGW